MYALEEVRGKGKGLIATRNIPMGSRILSEEPIIRVPDTAIDGDARLASLHRQVDALPPDNRRAFLSMHNVHADDIPQYLGVFLTNALPMVGKVEEAGIFLNACRINHACDNNAHNSWNSNIKRHTIHALRDIEQGEEITINYLGVLNTRETRQDYLQEHFAFTCSCHLCSLPPDESQESDRKLDELRELDDLIGGEWSTDIFSTPLRILQYLDQEICLHQEQGQGAAALPRAFLYAARLTVAHGDLARARVFFERARLGWTVLQGNDSYKVLRERALSQDPSKHDLYGFSTKWRTTVDEIPQGIDSQKFEDWLWKREKPGRSRQPADFRNRVIFPAFIDLPAENHANTELDVRGGTHANRPRRHWLYLAEIVAFTAKARPEMEVKDVLGTKVQLLVCPDEYDGELALSQVQKGYTIAILYAQRHKNQVLEAKIRNVKPAQVKVQLRMPPRKTIFDDVSNTTCSNRYFRYHYTSC